MIYANGLSVVLNTKGKRQFDPEFWQKQIYAIFGAKAAQPKTVNPNNIGLTSLLTTFEAVLLIMKGMAKQGGRWLGREMGS